MASTEVVTIEQVEDVLLHGGDLDVVNPDEVQADMVKRILDAGELSDAFASFKATPAADLDGVAVRVHGVAWMRSAFKEGPKVYALLDVEHLKSGERLVVSMGGRTLMASFVWAQRHDAMPFDGTFRKESSNANSERAFWTFKLA